MKRREQSSWSFLFSFVTIPETFFIQFSSILLEETVSRTKVMLYLLHEIKGGREMWLPQGENAS